METLIKLLEAEIKKSVEYSVGKTCEDVENGYQDGLRKAIDIIRENMPLTVSEVVEYLKNDNATIRMIIFEDESGHF